MDFATGDGGVVCEVKPPIAGEEVFEQGAFFVDELLREAVVAHRDGQVDPGDSGNEVRCENHGPLISGNFRKQEAWAVPARPVEGEVRPEGLRALARDDF